MGPDLGNLYHELHDECVWLNNVWKQFVELYGTNQRRLDVLNFAAPHFFFLLQDVLWQTTLLRLCRITDASRKKKHITVHLLSGLVTSAIADEVRVRSRTLHASVSFARDWRNRHIAHADFDLAMNNTAEPLAPATRKMVSDAISDLGNLLNIVELHYTGATTLFDHLSAPGQADDLLQWLNVAYVEEESFRLRLETHTLTDRDLFRTWPDQI